MVKIFKGKSNPTKKPHAITTQSQQMMGKVPRIKDIMTEDPLTFTLGTTVHDAAKKLLQKSAKTRYLEQIGKQHHLSRRHQR